MARDVNNSICKYRWSYPVIDIARGQTKTCCKTPSRYMTDKDFLSQGTDAFINSNYDQARRVEMLTGLRHKDCQSCWDTEKKGVRSMRIGSEGFTQFMNQSGIPGDFEEILNHKMEKLVRSDSPETLEIQLGNLCNLKCVYCSPEFSTAWEREAIQFGDMDSQDTQKANLKSVYFDENFGLG